MSSFARRPNERILTTARETHTIVCMEEHLEQPKPLVREEHQGEVIAPPREPSQFAVAMQIADRLGETGQKTRDQLVQTVRSLGRTQSLALLEETLEIEVNGGMMLLDGSRRRTAGGVFFQLVKTKGRPKEWPWLKSRKKPRHSPESGETSPKTHSPQPHSASAAPVFSWADRLTAIKAIGSERGAATVKITVIGRPGKIVEKGTCVVISMQSTNVPSLPKGLPLPPHVSTNYVVYIAAKQWRKVEAAIKDPEDILIVEGFPQFDAETESIAVFATNTTTKKLQSTQRQASV